MKKTTPLQNKKLSKNAGASFALRMLAAALLSGATVAGAETPDTFTWAGASGSDWFGSGVWTPTATSRTMPCIEGDTALVGQDNFVTVSSDITLSTLSVGSLTWDWKWVSFGALNSAAATMTFDAAGDDPYALFLMATGRTEFWSPLKLHLASPLKIKKGEYYNWKSIVRVVSAVEGGTVEAPAGIVVEGDIAVTLENAENSFCGDIQVGSSNNTGEAVLALGYEWNASAGRSEQLGNPTNRVILVNGDWKSQLCVANAGGGSLSGRTVLGSGKVVGAYYNEWRNQNLQNLNIGAGTVIKPCNVLTDSPFGTIVVYASSASIDAGSRLVLSVGSSVNDVVDYQVSAGFALNSSIEIEEAASNIPIGTSWNLITVKGNGAGFTFSPSSTPSNFFFSVSGNMSDGWVVSARKIRNSDGSSDRPMAVDAAATSIGETGAVANVNVAMLDPDGSATLRVYYGTTDGGSTPTAWGSVRAYPAPITQTGAHSFLLNGLTLGATHYYRHSISNSAGEFFSSDVVTFTTIPYTTPDTFTWIPTNGQWFGESVWTTASSNARRHPEFAGDNIVFMMGGGRWWNDYGVDRAVNLERDATVSTITIDQGPNNQLLFTATNGPAVLTFDAGASGTNRINSVSSFANLLFGTGNDELSVELKSPISFLRTSPYGYNIQVFSRLSGGTDGAPSDILLDTAADEYTHLYFFLLNTNNTFRGDIYVGAEGVFPATTHLCLGASPYLGGAQVNCPADDAMLGDRANHIILRNRATVRVSGAAGTPTRFERTLIGGGTLEAVNQRDQWNTETRSLHLSSAAHLEPAGTLTVSAAGFTADAAAEYAFTVSSTNGVSGVVAFAVSQPLTLTGKVVLTPSSNTERIPAGTHWDVVTVSKEATAFTCNLTRTPGFSLTTSGNSDSGWTVTATKTASGMLMELR